MTFKDLRIVEPILKALDAQGYTKPTEIQERAIPFLLRGKDLLGCAQTGTGKTAAFAVPILQNLFLDREAADRPKRQINALVVAPTRELAIQIDESFRKYGKYTGLRTAVIFGGVKQGRQVEALNKGVDILVATPGRLLDLMGQGIISLDNIDYFVLDEADQMLDMGFIHDIRKLIRVLPTERQSLFFSATMSKEITNLARQILGDPEKITIRPEQPTAERVEQALYFVSKRNKRKLLLHLLKTEDMQSTLVFGRTKHGADKIVRILNKEGIDSAAIHGNKSQNARQKALKRFKEGSLKVLVATDIAARGIDVDELSHVINFDLPNVPETYVHRIGRTGRAQASGVALSFCMPDERPYLKDIQKLIDQRIPVITDHPFEGLEDEEVNQPAEAGQQSRQRRQRPQNGRGARPGRNNRRR